MFIVFVNLVTFSSHLTGAAINMNYIYYWSLRERAVLHYTKIVIKNIDILKLNIHGAVKYNNKSKL
jgi:hypothetical protein